MTRARGIPSAPGLRRPATRPPAAPPAAANDNHVLPLGRVQPDTRGLRLLHGAVSAALWLGFGGVFLKIIGWIP